MKRNEVIDLLQDIEIFYPGKFKIENARIVELWQNAMAEEDAGKINKNLKRYVLHNEWPPSISQLVDAEPEASGPAVPTLEQTKLYLQGMDNQRERVKEELDLHGNEEIEQAKAEIRRILNIGGNEK